MMTILGIIWFVLVAVLIAVYFALDGFDLGAGVLHPFLGSDDEKAIARESIAPVWDGNEVWLLTAGGALFAAFPAAYAASFSGFYLAIMLVLFGLILRAVCLEFRAHEERFARLLDTGFFLGSLLPALLFGVAVGNVILGVPLSANGDYAGTFLALLNPFALMCGVLGLVHMIAQGAAWLAAKAPAGSGLHRRAALLRRTFSLFSLAMFVLASVCLAMISPATMPSGWQNWQMILAGGFAILYMAFTLAAGLGKGDRAGIVLEGLGAAALVGIVGATLFPNLIPATDPALSLTIANCASGDVTLVAMTVIAAIGVPLVLLYHVLVYRAFRGRIPAGASQDGRGDRGVGNGSRIGRASQARQAEGSRR